MTLVVLAPRPADRRLAERIRGALGETTDIATGALREHLPALFRAGTPLVVIGAAGMVIRLLAPELSGKDRDPPVVVVAPDGSCAVPLLGGHRGANRLARRIASALNAFAAITTASDSRVGLALDDPPAGWRVREPPDAAAFTGALLDGAPVRLVDETGAGDWLRVGALSFSESGRHEIVVSVRELASTPARLVLHPPQLVLGVGCARGADPRALSALARSALADAGLAAEAVACVVSIDLKADEPAVHALAEALGVPARFFRREELAVPVPSPSDAVERAIGIPSVAEAAALAAAGPNARLLVPKRKGQGVTVAVAMADRPIDATRVGRARGRLTIVGLGPGDPAHLTAAAAEALARANDLVGYRLYLELLAERAAGKRLHPFALGEEEERCRKALELAAEGREVALVCSGDPGIYAMASPLFELLAAEGEDRPTWKPIAVEVIPGISAMQLAAARCGAVIGHDFCAVSLSDLLTPAEVIERRIEAAAKADFVLALYNPVSSRRRSLLLRAREILLRHRPPSTPVVVARALAREGEEVRVITLDELDPTGVDMLTTVLVGASSSRTLKFAGRPWVFTPRGYRLS